MTTRITFHGVSCYEVEGPRGRLLIDPFFDGNPVADISADDLAPPDLILASHAAPDHMGDAARVAMRTGAAVVCGNDTAALLREAGLRESQIRRTVWGIRVQVGDLLINPVFCAHWSQARLADGSTITGTPLAFVFECERNVGIYHFGDSAVTREMELIGRLHRPTVGLLGVTQPWSLVGPGAGQVASGEMSPEEAALAAEMLGVKYAVATHYERPDHPDVQAFLRAVPARDTTSRRVPLALSAGQTLVVDGEDYEVVDQ